jgi:uncharacterized membrane protein
MRFRDRMSDRVTEFCGSWTFVLSFSVLITVWMVLNSILLLAGVFDPYPYIFLNLVLTIVSTFQGPLIMMSQNRSIQRDRETIQGLHQKLDTIYGISTASDRIAIGFGGNGGH